MTTRLSNTSNFRRMVWLIRTSGKRPIDSLISVILLISLGISTQAEQTEYKNHQYAHDNQTIRIDQNYTYDTHRSGVLELPDDFETTTTSSLINEIQSSLNDIMSDSVSVPPNNLTNTNESINTSTPKEENSTIQVSTPTPTASLKRPELGYSTTTSTTTYSPDSDEDSNQTYPQHLPETTTIKPDSDPSPEPIDRRDGIEFGELDTKNKLELTDTSNQKSEVNLSHPTIVTDRVSNDAINNIALGNNGLQESNQHHMTSRIGQPPLLNPSVKQPSLADLLLIIKHFRLAESQAFRDKIRDADFLSSDLTRLSSSNEATRIDKWIPSGEQIKERDNLPEKQSQTSKSGLNAKPIFKGSQISKVAANLSNMLNSPDNRGDLIKFPLKSTRYSLVSPYSANFESGMTFKNKQKRTSSLDYINLAEDQKRKIYEKLKGYHEVRIKDKIQGKNEVETNKSGLKGESVRISNHTKYKLSEPHSKSKANRSTNSNGGEQDDKNKHDERVSVAKRDMNKSQVSSKRPNYSGSAKIPLPKYKDHSATDKPSDEPTADDTNLSYTPSSQILPLQELSLSNGQGFIQTPVVNHLSLNGMNYGGKSDILDDPFKKSLYYSTDKSNDLFNLQHSLNMDDSNDQFIFSLGSKFVPNGGYQQDSIDMDSDRIPNESNSYGDFSYLPYNRYPIDTFKPDEDIKNSLAIKAIENPAVMAHILESINGYGKNIHQTKDLDLNQNMRKLYVNLMKVKLRPEPYDPISLPVLAASHTRYQATSPFTPVQATTTNMAALSEAAFPQRPQPIAVVPVGSATNNSGVNLMMTEMTNKWALSKMPDLIPIPLAATVPGYLIRLPNGQILAAALTSSFSIQGIQKGPLSASYTSMLNQRLKSLIKPKSQQSGYVGSDSNVQPVRVPIPQQMHLNEPKPSKDKSTGWFPRGVLSQLGLTAFTQRRNATKDTTSGRIRSGNKYNNGFSPLTSDTNLNELDLSSLPIADPDEPIFSFADESQISESMSDFAPTDGYIAPLAQNLAIPETSPVDLLQSASSTAIGDKLSQLLSLKSIIGDDLISGAKRRESFNKRNGMNMAPLCRLLLMSQNSSRSRSQTNHKL